MSSEDADLYETVMNDDELNNFLGQNTVYNRIFSGIQLIGRYFT